MMIGTREVTRSVVSTSSASPCAILAITLAVAGESKSLQPDGHIDVGHVSPHVKHVGQNFLIRKRGESQRRDELRRLLGHNDDTRISCPANGG